MTAVVRAMIDLASSLPELDVVPLLRSKDLAKGWLHMPICARHRTLDTWRRLYPA